MLALALSAICASVQVDNGQSLLPKYIESVSFIQDVEIEGQAQLAPHVVIRPDVASPMSGSIAPGGFASANQPNNNGNDPTPLTDLLAYDRYQYADHYGWHYYDGDGNGNNNTPGIGGPGPDWDLPLHYRTHEFPVITRVTYYAKDPLEHDNCSGSEQIFPYLVGSLASTGDRVYIGTGSFGGASTAYTCDDLITCPAALPEFENVYYNEHWGIEWSMYFTTEEVDLSAGACSISACDVVDIGVTTHRVHVFLEDSDQWNSACPNQLQNGTSPTSLDLPLTWSDEDPTETIAFIAASYANGATTPWEALYGIIDGMNNNGVPGNGGAVTRKPIDAQGEEDGRNLYYYGWLQAEQISDVRPQDPKGLADAEAKQVMYSGSNALVYHRNAQCRAWCEFTSRVLRMHGIDARPCYVTASCIMFPNWQDHWEWQESEKSSATNSSTQLQHPTREGGLGSRRRRQSKIL